MNILVINRNVDVAGQLRYQYVIGNPSHNGYMCKTYRQAVKLIKQHNIELIFVEQTDKRLVCLLNKHCKDNNLQYKISLYNVPEQFTMPTKWVSATTYIENKLTSLLDTFQAYTLRNIYQVPFHYLLLGILKLFNIHIVQMITHRFGHLAMNNYCWLVDNENRKGTFIGLADEPASDQIYKMLERAKFDSIIQNPKLKQLLANPIIQKSTNFESTNWYRGMDVPYWKMGGPDKVFYKWTEAEEIRGQELLASYGLSKDDWYICFHNRDSKYLAEKHDYLSKEQWAYHDYRDCHIRNYVPAVQWINKQGGYAFRVGMAHDETLSQSDMMFDLTTANDDFANIYLLAHCKFLLGAGDGVAHIPTVFGKPIALANYPILETITDLRKGDLCLVKLIWYEEEKRYLNMNEWTHSGVSRFMRSEEFAQRGLCTHENTDEEILELCQEMQAKLDGAWVEQEGDAELYELYRSYIDQDHLWCQGCPGEIAMTFLRRHKVDLFPERYI